MKYVIVKKNGNFEEAILLPPTMSHKDVVSGQMTAISAGECTMGTNNGRIVVQAFGESVTLKLKSRPQDADVILLSLEVNLY